MHTYLDGSPFRRWCRLALVALLMASSSGNVSNASTCYASQCYGAGSYEIRCAREREKELKYCGGNKTPVMCQLARGNAENYCGCTETCASKAVCIRFSADGSGRCTKAEFR